MCRIFKSDRPYIKEEQKQLVREHKYVGQCFSYSYKYIHSPLSEAIVKRLPRTLS